MRLALMIEGQEHVTRDDWVALADTCERSGIEALFRSDHYGSVMGQRERGALPLSAHGPRVPLPLDARADGRAGRARRRGRRGS